MLHLSAKRHRSIIRWEDALWKTFLATIQRTDYSIWFIGWVSSYYCKGPVKNPSIWKESLSWIVPRIRFVRGGNLEGWRTGCRPCGVGNDGRIRNLLKKFSMRKRWYFPKKKGEFIFPIADGRIKTLGGDQDLRTSTLVRHRPIQGESNIDFLGESEGSLPPPQDSFPDASEAINYFWSMTGNFIYNHHVEPRVKLYSPREESFPIPPKYIDVSWTTHEFGCQARETHRWPLEYRWVTRLVWSLDGFHTIYSTRRKSSRRIYVVRQEINEETSYIQARSSMARAMEVNGKAC